MSALTQGLTTPALSLVFACRVCCVRATNQTYLDMHVPNVENPASLPILSGDSLASLANNNDRPSCLPMAGGILCFAGVFDFWGVCSGVVARGRVDKDMKNFDFSYSFQILTSVWIATAGVSTPVRTRRARTCAPARKASSSAPTSASAKVRASFFSLVVRGITQMQYFRSNFHEVLISHE